MFQFDLSRPGLRSLARSPYFVGPVALGAIVVGCLIIASWPRRPVDRPRDQTPIVADDAERRLARAIERARASTVAIEYGAGDESGARRVATGVVVSDRGDVLSVRVDPPKGRARESILARDASGHRHQARWVAADPDTGLTLLKLDAHDIQPIKPSARAAVLGAAVFLVGNPYGLAHSVSRGHVSGLSRRLEINAKPLGGLIQVQAPIYPGDSGALLADMQGGWLGLVRSGLAVADPKNKDDLGFAIPAEDALWVAGQLLDHQKVDRAFLGIKLSPDSPNLGAEVSSVIANSPAEQAKLQAGDRIIKLDDQEIATAGDLTDRLDRTRAGTEVTLELLRGETLESVTVVTATRPTQPPPVSIPAPAPPPKPDPTPATEPKASATPQPNAATALPREVLERIERLEKELSEYHRRDRDSQRESRSVP